MFTKIAKLSAPFALLLNFSIIVEEEKGCKVDQNCVSSGVISC